MKRRQFLRRIGAASALTSATSFAQLDRAMGAESISKPPVARTGPPRLNLSLAAYSFRKHFATMKGKSQTPPHGKSPLTMVDFLDYCVAHEYAGAELTSYFFPQNADNAYYRSLKRAAFLRGIAVSGTAIGNRFTGPPDRLEPHVQKAIESIAMAQSLGAPHIRFFAGSGDELRKHPDRIESVCGAVLRCAEVAEKAGVFLGIENHGNLTSDQMMQLMDRLDHPWIGVNLDTGNFFTDSAYQDLERCLPYAVNIQVKVMMRRPDRTKYPADLDRIGKMIRDSGYQGFVVLEYEEEAPFEEIPRYTEELRKAIGV